MLNENNKEKSFGKFYINKNEEKKLSIKNEEYEYAGFVDRIGSIIIDGIIIYIPIKYAEKYFYLRNTNVNEIIFLFDAVIPIVIFVFLWTVIATTPGKRLLNLYIVDEKNKEKISVIQGIIRASTTLISFWTFGLGFFWIIFDNKKQSWHDKIAKTIVIKRKSKEIIE